MIKTYSISSKIFTVSGLNKKVRQLLECEIGHIWLLGEISNFAQPTSGHWYFTLKDDSTQVRCAVFRHSNRSMNTLPRNGQQILVRAILTLYEARGEYQLVADSMQPVGEGLLQHKFQTLKNLLSNEGLFDQVHKKKLPHPAYRVGIITSINGAALHDILQVLKRRDPLIKIVIYPTLVQGQEAPEQIVRAIEVSNRRKECDVLIVTRGGGSLEDLASFNDERVVRAIFASHLPIVSAVGHETDVTITDFVADIRAPTPSAAAEMVSRNKVEFIRQIHANQHRLKMAMNYFITQRQQIYNGLQHRLQQQHPQIGLAHQKTLLMVLTCSLKDHVQRQLYHYDRLYHKLMTLIQEVYTMRINSSKQRIQLMYSKLNQHMRQQLSKRQNHFIKYCSFLEGVSPLRILSRGFSITTNKNGLVIKSTNQLSSKDILITRLSDGWIESEVTKISFNNK